MYLRSDQAENIQLVSKQDLGNCQLFTGDVPDDFFDTIGWGKYQFINGETTPVEGWVIPELNLFNFD